MLVVLSTCSPACLRVGDQLWPHIYALFGGMTFMSKPHQGTVLILVVGCLAGLSGCGPAIQASAGAGFAGIDIAEALVRPAICRTPTTCKDTLLTDSVDLVRNTRYSWRPTVSTGITARWFPARLDPLGFGIGTHVAFVPETSGKTSPFPAVALTLGKRDGTEAMIGLILSPTDDVIFPDGSNKF